MGIIILIKILLQYLVGIIWLIKLGKTTCHYAIFMMYKQ